MLKRVLLLGWGSRRRAVINPTGEASREYAQPWRFLGFAAVAGILIYTMWWTDPEQTYRRGHEHFNAREWTDAAALFDRAYEGRHAPARKAEALFWAARSLDIGDEKQQASARYEILRSDYPENYWYAESTFRLIEIRLRENRWDDAASLYAELLEKVPDSRWTLEAGSLLGKVAEEPGSAHDD
jgi:TolA-binding protein